MDIYYQRNQLKKEAEAFLKSQLGENVELNFWNLNECNSENAIDIKKFKLLFHSKHQVALWNELFDSYVAFSQLNKNLFSKEEWEFIETAEKTSIELSNDNDNLNNINKPIELHNICLVALNNEHIEYLSDFFEQHPEEFLKYSTLEYSDRNFNVVFKTSNEYMFAIKSKTNEELIGVIALKEISDFACVFNIEYYVLPLFRKKGYAIEACNALLEYAFAERLVAKKDVLWYGIREMKKIKVELVEIRTSSENIASQKVAQKLGFEFAGIVKRGYRIDSLKSFSDLYLYFLEKRNEFKDKEKKK